MQVPSSLVPRRFFGMRDQVPSWLGRTLTTVLLYYQPHILSSLAYQLQILLHVVLSQGHKLLFSQKETCLSHSHLLTRINNSIIIQTDCIQRHICKLFVLFCSYNLRGSGTSSGKISVTQSGHCQARLSQGIPAPLLLIYTYYSRIPDPRSFIIT